MPQAGTLTSVRSAVCAQATTRGTTPTLIAFDGRSGSGKSTLAHQLAIGLDAAVVHADDFYSGGSLSLWLRRSAEQRADLCIDWARLRREALVPLLAARPATWRPFDWDTESELSGLPTVLQPAPFVILDGAFSTRPELLDLIDYAVIATAPDATRRERLEQREGATYARNWHPVWNAAENHYFTHLRRPEDFDARLATNTAM